MSGIRLGKLIAKSIFWHATSVVLIPPSETTPGNTPWPIALLPPPRRNIQNPTGCFEKFESMVAHFSALELRRSHAMTASRLKRRHPSFRRNILIVRSELSVLCLSLYFTQISAAHLIYKITSRTLKNTQTEYKNNLRVARTNANTILNPAMRFDSHLYPTDVEYLATKRSMKLFNWSKRISRRAGPKASHVQYVN